MTTDTNQKQEIRYEKMGIWGEAKIWVQLRMKKMIIHEKEIYIVSHYLLKFNKNKN